jgi:hypothetical protein
MADERPARIELNRPGDVIRDRPEIRAGVADQVDAGSDQQKAAHQPLERDQAEDDRPMGGALGDRASVLPARPARAPVNR